MFHHSFRQDQIFTTLKVSLKSYMKIKMMTNSHTRGQLQHLRMSDLISILELKEEN